MPRDPYAALHALLRAEAVRTTPPKPHGPPGGETDGSARSPRPA